MRNTARQTREIRTITVDFQHESTYVQLLDDGKAFLEFVFAFLLSLGFQLSSCCRFALYPSVCHAADSFRRRASWYSYPCCVPIVIVTK